MSDGIQKVAGSKMRSILSKMTSNRFLGITTGFILTALLQSSSATTVMIVSFVNAGLLKFGRIHWSYYGSKYWNYNYCLAYFNTWF